jgi:hypothetical protein
LPKVTIKIKTKVKDVHIEKLEATLEKLVTKLVTSHASGLLNIVIGFYRITRNKLETKEIKHKIG